MADQVSRKRSVAAKSQPVEPARHYAPRGIAALLAPVLRPALRRRGAALATLIEDWPAIVGPDVAARSLPVKCASGTLTIGCAGPDALEFQHMAPALIARINLAAGGQTIARLRFIDLPPVDQVRPIRSGLQGNRHGGALIVPTDGPPFDGVSLLDGPVGEALARLARGLRTRRNPSLG